MSTPRTERTVPIHGWFRDENRRGLSVLINQIQPKTALEIGSFLGLSASFLAKQVDKLYCIDRFREDATEAGMNNLVSTLEAHNLPNPFFHIFEENMRKVGVWHKIVPIQGDSLDPAVAAQVTDELDLVYIDGDHTYAGCRSDIITYGLNKVRAGGIICGDDFQVQQNGKPWFPGVHQAVAELCPGYRWDGSFWWYTVRAADKGVYRPPLEPRPRPERRRLVGVRVAAGEGLGPNGKPGIIRWVHDHFDHAAEFANRDGMLRYGLRYADPSGLVCEFGVDQGMSIRYIAHILPEQIIYGFDSFYGLPENGRRPDGNWIEGQFDNRGLAPTAPPNVKFQIGLFEDTIPSFLAEHPEPASYLHIDCDLYTSAKTILTLMAPRIVPGTLLQFDEFVGFEGWEELSEARALYETGWNVECLGVMQGKALFRVR